MNEPTGVDWLDAWGSIIGGLATLVAVGLAARQLRGLVRQIKQSNLISLMTLEIELANRKHALDEAAKEVRLSSLLREDFEKCTIAYDFMQGCLENYLNVADRLAFCILNRYVREKDFKTEYRHYFRDFVTAYPEYFGPESRYDNIIKICRRWKIFPPEYYIELGYERARGRSRA